MSTGAHKQKHVRRRTRRRCRWRYRDVSVHSSSIVQTCCGPVSERRIYNSILLLSVVRPRATRRSQRLCRTIMDSSMELQRRWLSFLLNCGGVMVPGVGDQLSHLCDLGAFCCLLFVVCCAVLCCVTFRACTACAAYPQKRPKLKRRTNETDSNAATKQQSNHKYLPFVPLSNEFHATKKENRSKGVQYLDH